MYITDPTAFFAIQTAGGTKFTRDGSFSIDENGDLVLNGTGYYVMGWLSTDGETINTNGDLSKISLNGETTLKDTSARQTETVSITGNVDSSDAGLVSGRDVKVEIYGETGEKYTLTFTLNNAGDEDASTIGLSLTGAVDSMNNSLTLAENSTAVLTYNTTVGLLQSVDGTAADSATFNLPEEIGGTGTISVDLSALTGKASATEETTASDTLPSWVSLDSASSGAGYMAATYTTIETYTDANGASQNASIQHSAVTYDFTSFSAANRDELIGTGFYVSPVNSTSQVSIVFISGSENTVQESNGNYVYSIGVDNITSGQDLVEAIADATGENPGEGYLNISANGAYLTIYDSRSSGSDTYGDVTWDSWNGVFDVRASSGSGTVGTPGIASYNDTTVNTSLEAVAGDVNGDGAGSDEIMYLGYVIDDAGRIFYRYNDNTAVLVAQIAVAKFENATGLVSEGENLFSASANTGAVSYMDVGQTGGTIRTGALEMSNVDLAEEFSRMIVTQRAFQANSRIITTSDEMLQTAEGLKR